MIEFWLGIIIAVLAAVAGVLVTYFSMKARIDVLKALREKEEQVYSKTLKDLKEANAKAIEATTTQLALDNEKLLKAREESLKKEAAETMKNITGGLDLEIKQMKASFEAQIALFPAMIQEGVQDYIDRYSAMEGVLAWKMPGAGGGGYLALVIDDKKHMPEGAIELHIRRGGM